MTEACDWVLRIEAVNLSASVFNTSDLSTMRGASLALEEACEVMGPAVERAVHDRCYVEQIYAGGAQAAYLLSDCSESLLEDVAQQMRQSLAAGLLGDGDVALPTGELCWVVDYQGAVGGDENVAVDAAMLKSRFRQMRMPSLPSVESMQTPAGMSLRQRQGLLCPIDTARPIDPNASIWVRPGQFNAVELRRQTRSGKVVSVEHQVASRTKMLRDYGRQARQRLYGKRYGFTWLGQVRFSESFQDLVDSPPPDQPLSARNKMAVFYLDGAGFGALREQVGLRKFSNYLRDLYIDTLLQGVLRYYDAGWRSDRDRYALFRYDHADTDSDPQAFYRFETLFLGGEDWCFVTPGWLASEITEVVFDLLEKFNAEQEQSAGLRLGVLICPIKTPIRRAKDLAHNLCDGARAIMGAGGVASAIDIEIMESVDIPDEALADQRRRRLGRSGPEEFCFDADHWHESTSRYRSLEDLPRSQLHRLIEATTDKSEDAAEAAVAECLAHAPDAKRVIDSFVQSTRASSLSDALPGGGDLAFRLKRLYELWDYAVQQPAPLRVNLLGEGA